VKLNPTLRTEGDDPDIAGIFPIRSGQVDCRLKVEAPRKNLSRKKTKPQVEGRYLDWIRAKAPFVAE